MPPVCAIGWQARRMGTVAKHLLRSSPAAAAAAAAALPAAAAAAPGGVHWENLFLELPQDPITQPALMAQPRNVTGAAFSLASPTPPDGSPKLLLKQEALLAIGETACSLLHRPLP